MAIVTAARGGSFAAWPQLAVGAALVLIGNALGKSRPNRLIGIRTPWTLANADTWTATNRLAGWTFVVAGFGMWASMAVSHAVPVPWLVGALIAVCIGLGGYSYLDFQRR